MEEVLMPYIDRKRRDEIANGSPPQTTGELNFVLTTTITDYLHSHGLRYVTINDIEGAFVSAIAEFRRRIVGPYEDDKRRENGDVYPEWVQL